MKACHNVKKKGNDKYIIEHIVLDARKKISKIVVTNGDKRTRFGVLIKKLI